MIFSLNDDTEVIPVWLADYNHDVTWLIVCAHMMNLHP